MLLAKSWEPGKLVKFLGIIDKQTQDFIKSNADYGLIKNKYKLSPTQAQAILDLRLQKLTNLEQEKIFADYESAINEIKQYIKILTHTEELYSIMKNELEDIKKEYGEPRRSLVSSDEGELRKEDLIKKEEVIVVLTKADYVKRLPAAEFKSQRLLGLKMAMKRNYCVKLIPMT